MNVNQETLNGLIRYYKDDKGDIDMIVNAIETFEEYHQAIFRLETTRRLFSCGALEAENYRVECTQNDKLRTVSHDAVLAQVNYLNRLAEEAGLQPFCDGIVSGERPWRREVADAVLDFVRNVIVNRA